MKKNRYTTCNKCERRMTIIAKWYIDKDDIKHNEPVYRCMWCGEMLFGENKND